MVSIKWDNTLFTKCYISHIISCNWSQTLRFEHLITWSISPAAQFWPPPYVEHNIGKCQVILAIIIQKYIFSILYYYQLTFKQMLLN